MKFGKNRGFYKFLDKILIQVYVNGNRGLVGASAASHVGVVELRPEQGQWRRRESRAP